MKIKDVILELRKNPTVNTKLSVNDAIAKALDDNDNNKIPDILPGIANLFVSITKVDKLGINPKSEFDTPIGIFAYPAEYVHERLKGGKDTKSLPFAGEYPYVNIFSVRGNIIDLNNITPKELNAYYDKLENYWIDIMQHYRPLDDNNIDDLFKIFEDSKSNAMFKDKLGGQLWYVTMEMADYMSPIFGSAAPKVWNRIFRSIGIDGCVDNEGTGIIHTSEKTQAVFFSINAIKNVHRMKNSHNYSSVNLERKKDLGASRNQFAIDTRKMLDRMSPEEQWKYITYKTNDNSKNLNLSARAEMVLPYIRDPNVRWKLLDVRNDLEIPFSQRQVISKLGKLSDKEIKFVIDQDPNNGIYLKFNGNLKNLPDWAAQQLVLAGQQNWAIKYVKNPSEEVQKVMVDHDGMLIEKLLKFNPSEQVKQIAVEQNRFAIKFIKNPSIELQKTAVLQGGEAINYINDPSEEIQMLAIRAATQNLNWIKNPTEKVQLRAVALTPGTAIAMIIQKGIVPSEAVQWTAVTRNGNAIIPIIKSGIIPSEAVQLAAVTSVPAVIEYFYGKGEQLRPSLEVVNAAKAGGWNPDEFWGLDKYKKT
jgi:hypothetical protein